MHHGVATLQSTAQAFAIAHITEKEAQLGKLIRRKQLLQLPLLQFIAAVNNDAADIRKPLQQRAMNALPKLPVSPAMRILEL